MKPRQSYVLGSAMVGASGVSSVSWRHYAQVSRRRWVQVASVQRRKRT